MNAKINDVKNFDRTMYEVIKGICLHMPNWQRTYDWDVDTAEAMLKDIFVSVYAGPGSEEEAAIFGNIILHYADNGDRIVVADGHTRLMTFRIFLQAFFNVCEKKRINIGYHPLCTVRYDLDIANNEYQKFVSSPVGPTKYGMVYVMACRYFDTRVRDKQMAMAVLDTMINRVYVGVTECKTLNLAQTAFVERNSTGKNLSNTEMISSFLQSTMDIRNITLQYEYKEIEDVLEGYYYCKLGRSAKAAFKLNTIKDFLYAHVINSDDNMIAFKEYLERIQEFKKTMWYVLLDKCGDKNVMLGYVLAGKGYDMSGKDDTVNAFLNSIVVFDIAVFARNANAGGGVSGEFKRLRQIIGTFCESADKVEKDRELNVLHKDFIAWVKQNEYKYNASSFKNFARSLDNMKDDGKEALLLYIYMKHNKNSMPFNVNFDHTYPQKPSKAWYTNPWPRKDSSEQGRMINCLGNRVLFDATWNKEMSNACMEEKKAYYIPFFASNHAFKSIEFSWDDFMKDGQKYLDTRRDRLAFELVSGTKLGKILAKI